MKSPYKLPQALGLLLVCAGLFLAAAGSTAFAQPKNLPARKGAVNDFANVIDDATEKRLDVILVNFEQMTGTPIVVATIPSLEERPVEDYANALYRSWGIGAKSGDNKDKGALLLLAPQDRKTRLEVGYGLEGDLPDGLAGEIIRRMRPHFQKAEFSQGIEVGVRTLVDTLAEKWNVSVAGIDRSYAYRPAKAPELSGKAVLILFAILFFFIIIMGMAARSARRRMASTGAGESLWWLAPIIFNRGGGNFGGGSWNSSGGWGDHSNSSGDSGWSSGGSGSDWSGFGGGSSGGGGASDSW